MDGQSVTSAVDDQRTLTSESAALDESTLTSESAALDESTLTAVDDQRTLTNESSAVDESTLTSESAALDESTLTAVDDRSTFEIEVTDLATQPDQVTPTTGIVEEHLLVHRQVPINTFMDIIPVLQAGLARLKHPMIKEIEEKTGISREKFMYIIFASIAFIILFAPCVEPIINLILILYPLRQSLISIHTGDETEQWIIFWVFFACSKLTDSVPAIVGFVIDVPEKICTTAFVSWAAYCCYSSLTLLIMLLRGRVCVLVKTIFIVYLELPQTYGAINFYVAYVGPKMEDAIGFAYYMYDWSLWTVEWATYFYHIVIAFSEL
uniref:Receptor expression-enhancing protein n=1 Tax=Globodera rostochiensis TaxID=31243 RepID=A0A914HWD1_GLORO